MPQAPGTGSGPGNDPASSRADRGTHSPRASDGTTHPLRASDRTARSLRASDGTTLYVQVVTPEGELRGAVLVVHGWGEHQGLYDEFTEALVGRGWLVWRYDQRGHGRSEGRRGHTSSFHRLVEDLREVWRFMESEGPGAPRRFLLGHSMGGLVVLRALQVRAIAPDGVCLSAPWLKTRIPVPGWKAWLSRVLDRVCPILPFPNPIGSDMLTSDPERRRIRDEDPRVHHWITPRLAEEVRRAQFAALNTAPPQSVPLLALIPLADPVVDPQVTAHFVDRWKHPETRIVLVEGARHEPLNEVDRRDRFDEVGAFFLRLSEQERTSEEGPAS